MTIEELREKVRLTHEEADNLYNSFKVSFRPYDAYLIPYLDAQIDKLLSTPIPKECPMCHGDTGFVSTTGGTDVVPGWDNCHVCKGTGGKP